MSSSIDIIKYNCTLTVGFAYDISLLATYKSKSEKDLVHEIVEDLIKSECLKYTVYKKQFNQCERALQAYKKECEETKIAFQPELWLKYLYSQPTWVCMEAPAPVLLYNKDSNQVDTKVCDKDVFLERLKQINTFLELEQLTDSFSRGYNVIDVIVHCVSDPCTCPNKTCSERD